MSGGTEDRSTSGSVSPDTVENEVPEPTSGSESPDIVENEVMKRSIEMPRISDYNRERAHDRMRGAIGILLVSFLGFVMVAPWVSLWTKSAATSDIKEIFALVSGPLIGLIGAATGFYFGERSRSE